MKALLIVPDYPNNFNQSFQFVHDRVREYKKEFDVDVFCFNKSKKRDYNFENVDVKIGDKNKFLDLLNNNNYDIFLFHFLNEKYSSFIIKYLKEKKVCIWFHGTDSLSWKRRLSSLNFVGINQLNPVVILRTLGFILLNKVRIYYIRKINEYCPNVVFVFVSEWNKLASEKDLKIKYNNSVVISNYLKSNVYSYKEKQSADRLNVLSINNYFNLVYAGDITQKIILAFSKKKEFNNFKFSIYGNGKLFNKYTKKIAKFKNVSIHKKTFNEFGIKEVHDQNGIFLYPKRGDSQGISRCEAMSSGLVPIASDVEAVSEFSPTGTCYLVNSVDDFVNALIKVYNDPKDYLSRSIKSSKLIQEKLCYEKTIQKEINLIIRRGKKE